MFWQKINWKKCTDVPYHIKWKHIENWVWVELAKKVLHFYSVSFLFVYITSKDFIFEDKFFIHFSIFRIGSSFYFQFNDYNS